MLRTCEADGCDTLTFGPLCVTHEPTAEPRRFPRGRPYHLENREAPLVGAAFRTRGSPARPSAPGTSTLEPEERSEVTVAERRIEHAWPALAEQSPVRSYSPL